MTTIQLKRGDTSRDLALIVSRLGQQLLNGWGLPDHFANIVAYHHDLDSGNRKTASLTAVRFGCRMADVIGYGYATQSKQSYRNLLKGLPDSVANLFPVSSEELAVRLKAKIDVIELQ